MVKDILYNNMNFPDRAAARAVCLGFLRVVTMEAVTRLKLKHIYIRFYNLF